MARDLRPNALLASQARDGDNGGQESADLEAAWRVCRERVGEEGPVVRLEDVGGQVGVGVGELGEEFGGVGLVDCIPKDAAAVGGRVEVDGCGKARSGEVRMGIRMQEAYRADSVARPCLTGPGRCRRRAVRLLITWGQTQSICRRKSR